MMLCYVFVLNSIDEERVNIDVFRAIIIDLKSNVYLLIVFCIDFNYSINFVEKKQNSKFLLPNYTGLRKHN